MREEPLISVIVPVYNVKDYLSQCLDSILAQSYKNYELIIVNDGSTDSSDEICERYSKKDDRIRFFSKENGGLSDARNYCIDRAYGEFLTFIDSDDYVQKEFLENLYSAIKLHNADIAIGKTKIVFDDNTTEFYETKEKELTAEEAFGIMCINTDFGVSSWGKLYRKELFETARYPKGMLYEDLLTTP